MITAEQIKILRDKTGVSVSTCKKALEQAGGDMEKAIEFLRKESVKAADKKADRVLGAGVVEAYVHGNKQIGVLVELKSESDFVSRNPEFQALARDLAMHIAATNPSGTEDLLKEQYIKNPNISVQDLIRESIQKFGENIIIANFARFSVS